MKRFVILLLALGVVLSLSACSGQPGAPVADILSKVKDAIKDDMLAQGMSEQDFKEGLPGFIEADLIADETDMYFTDPEILDKTKIAEGAVLAPMFNINSDEIIILKAKDKSAVEALEASLQKEKENRLKQWETYLPAQHEKVKNTVIKVSGLYLLYGTYRDASVIEGAFDLALSGK